MSHEDYVSFFLSAPAMVARIECLEISHSKFSQIYRVVRNATRGITVTHEDGQEYFYEYYPLQLKKLGSYDDLDSGFSVSLGDVGEIMGKEIKNVIESDAILEKPVFVYRAYRSDLLTRPLDGPRRLEIKDVTQTPEGCAFDAKAPAANINRTGETYTIDRFPELRAFI